MSENMGGVEERQDGTVFAGKFKPAPDKFLLKIEIPHWAKETGVFVASAVPDFFEAALENEQPKIARPLSSLTLRQMFGGTGWLKITKTSPLEYKFKAHYGDSYVLGGRCTLH